MVATYPAANNAYVPSHEASGKLVVNYSRNPTKFALPRYVQYVPVELSTGYYLEMTVEEAGRVVNGDGADFAWPDGADAPDVLDGTESFNFKSFLTQRFAFGYRLGKKTVDQASWDIIAQHGAIKAQQAMTFRTLTVATLLTTAGNWDSSHTSDVQSITGNTGTWAASTTARQDVKRSLNSAADQIIKDTLGAVDPEDLHLVLNPTEARKLSESQEIVDHIKGSPDALAQVRGELPGRNVMFGLPDTLYGFKVEVERTVRVTTRKKATTSKSYVFPAQKAALIARPGELEGVAGAPNFSTVVLFLKEDMTVETLNDVNNRVTKGRVVDDYDAKLISPVSGFLFTTTS